MNKDGYALVWSDEFDGKEIDRSIWNYEIGYIRNHELQYYSDSMDNARLENSFLILEARKENKNNMNYTSGSINTRGKIAFQYGIFEMRAKLPKGKGMWPAFWMMGEKDGWPRCGETDIMELIGGGEGRDDTSYGTLHWPDKNGKHVSSGEHKLKLESGVFNDDFHIFGIKWTEKEIIWYIDGNEYTGCDITSDDQKCFHQPYYMLLNLAIGGDWPGSPDESTVFPNQYIVDYVRVYQEKR